MGKGIYSMGLCGYEIWDDPNDSDRMMARFIGGSKEYKDRSYTVQFTPAGRAFIRPDGRRIYLDEVLRSNL